MNIHKNARLTLARGIEVVGAMINQSLTRAAAARMAGVCEATVRKWLGRYLAKGEADWTTAPRVRNTVRHTTEAETALAIVKLRRRRLTHARIAASLGVSKNTLGC